MKFKILLLTIAIQSSISFAEEKFLIRSTDVRAENFKIFLNLNPSFKTYTKYWQSQQPGTTESEQLARLAAEAQKSYLSADKQKSIDAFKSVTELSLDADWNRGQRAAIFISFLRLAQLDESKRNQWINAALCFDPDQDISADLFAPPMQSAFNDAKNAKTFETFKNQNSDFPLMLVNGRSVQLNQSIKVCSERARYSYVSDAFQPITRVDTLDLLENWNPSKRVLISGTCDNAKLPEENLIPRKRAFALFNDSCIKDLTTEETATAGVAFPKSMEKRPNWIQRNWIWTGLGILAGAVVATEVQRQSQDRESTHIEGF